MDLQEELLKLTEIAPQPPDLSFLIGYLAGPLPRRSALGVKPALQQLIAFLRDGLISPLNTLQLVAVLKLRVMPSAKAGEEAGRIASQMQTLAGELICDKEYLTRRYFQERPPEGIVQESMGVDCAICTLQIGAAQMCYLSCGHMYHRNCLEAHSQERVSRKALPLKCPAEECAIQLLIQEVREYLSKELRQKHDEFTFQSWVQDHSADTSWCPTPGCQAVFCFDAALDNYKCPSCKHHYCLRCKCEMHAELTCAEYRKIAQLDEPDRKFIMLVKGAKYKQCPNCKFWVEKNEGCDHMTCRCKYEFCYVCGGKYGACRCNGHGGQQPEELFIELPIAALPEVNLGPSEPIVHPLPPPSPRLANPKQFRPLEGIPLLSEIMPVDQIAEPPAAQQKQEIHLNLQEKPEISLQKKEEKLQLRQKQKEEVEVEVQLMPIKMSERKPPLIGYCHNRIPHRQPLIEPSPSSRWDELREKIHNTRLKLGLGKGEKREE